MTTTAATARTTTGATLNGNVTSDGGSAVTDRGFVYKTSSGVTIADNKTTVAGTTGAYSLTPSLSSNTQYYFRAYAINAVNTTLGSELDFWTLASTPTAPVVSNPTSSSLDVAIGSGDGNNAGVTYAIQETGSGLYVQAGGTLSATAVYQTAATWGTKTVTGLTASTSYTFQVAAQNGGGDITAFGATASGMTNSGAGTFTSFQPGDWNTGATWVGGMVPTAGATVTIDHAVTLAAPLTNTGFVTVSASGSLAVSATYTNNGTTTINGSFQLNNGGFAAGTNFVYGAAGTLVFGNTAGSYGVNNDAYWPSASGPFHVTVGGSGGITLNVPRSVAGTFQTSATVNGGGNLTLNGTNQLNAGAFFSTSPVYGASSTLVYNTAYGVSNEWTGSGAGAGGARAVGSGQPANVTVQAGTLTLDGNPRYLPGNFTLTAGGLTLSGGGDLTLGGNWTRTSGTFTHNNVGVWFTGASGTQTITGNAGEAFGYLILNKAAGSTQLGSAVTVTATAGSTLQLLGAGTLDLNGNSLALTGSGGNLLVSGGVRNIVSSGAADVFIQGSKTVTSASGGSLVVGDNIFLTLTAGFDPGAGLTTVGGGTSGNLLLNPGGFVTGNAPKYGAGSTLIYNVNAVYGRGLEWSAAAGPIGTAGYPHHVRVTSTTTLNYPNGGVGPLAMGGTLEINTGSALYMDYSGGGAGALTVAGGVTLGGDLSLGNAVGGDLNVGGNWTRTAGTFTPNNRTVTFNGGSAQTISGAANTNFAFLTVNNAAGVVINQQVGVTTQLTLTSGIVNTTGGQLSIFATAPGAVSGGSATAYVNGQLRRTLSIGLSLGSVYLFPIGKGGVYAPFELVDPTTNGGSPAIVAAETFPVNSGGTGGSLTLNTNRYWETTVPSNISSLIGTAIRLTDPSIGSANVLASSNAQSGTYSSIGGTVVGNSILSNLVSSPSGYLPFLVMASAAPTIDTMGTLAAFTTEMGTPSTEQSFTASGVNLTADIVVTPPAGFEVSLAAAGPYAGSLNLTPTSGTVASTSIFVRLTGAAVGTFSGNVTLTSTGATTRNVAIPSSTVRPQTPTVQASAASVTGTTLNTATVSWTRGNGANVIVLMKASGAVDANPVNGTAYAANAAFGTGTQIGTGNRVVYIGTGTSVPVTNLAAGTTYHVAVYEFNGTGSNLSYNTTAPALASGPTLTIIPTSPTFSAVTSTSFTVSWNPAVNGAASYRLDVATDNLFTSFVPGYNDLTVVPTSQSVTGLSANTQYFVRVRAINSAGQSSGNSSTASQTTNQLSAPVATAATSITATTATANWNAVSGASDYRIDVYRKVAMAATDLFISEYLEGSNSNKYIEIYNGTGASVNLADYRLRLYANGASSPTNDVLLSGTLPSGSTIVYRDASATIYGGTATNNTACNFNGDDAVALFKISTASNVDIFGRIGEDPGTAWTGSFGLTTLDRTLRRKSTVTGGVTVNPSSGFPTLSTEWELASLDNVTGLGAHTFGPALVPVVTNVSTGGSLSYAISGLDPATNYFYVVRATSTNSTSNDSNEISFTTLTPTLALTGTPAPFSTTFGTASTEQSFPVGGTDLTANATATAPAGYEVSADGTTYGATATYVPSSGAFSGNVFVRLTATTRPGDVLGTSLTLSSTGATTQSLTLSGAVAKKQLGIAVTGATSFTFNGTPQGPAGSNVTGEVSGFPPTGAITFSYADAGGAPYGPSPLAPTNAGGYNATATIADDADYFGIGSMPYGFIIDKATPSLVLTGSPTYTYNAGPQGPMTYQATGVMGFPPTGLVTFSYSGSSFAGSYGPTFVAPTDAGSYMAGGQLAADTNYNSAVSPPFFFSIAQRNLDVTADSGQFKNKGASDPGAFTYAQSGLQGSDFLIGNLERAPGEAAGLYAINQGTLQASPNYNLSYTGANFAVAGPLGTADVASKPTDSTAIKIPIATLLGNDQRVTPAGTFVSSSLSLTAVTPGVGNGVTIGGAFVFFTPNPSSSSETFSYTLTDTSNSTTDTVTVTVTTAANPSGEIFTINLVNAAPATYDSGNDTTSKVVDFIAVPGQSMIVEYATSMLGPWLQANGGVPISTGATGSFFTTLSASGDQTGTWNSAMFFRGKRP